MKKLFLTLLLTLAVVGASAQSGYDPRFFNNQFISLGGGVSLYNNQNALTSGINVEATWGNWVLQDVALRLSGGMFNAKNAKELDASYINGHLDVMFDVINMASGTYDEQRLISFYPMFGFGVINRGALKTKDTSYSNDLDVTFMVGAQCEFRIPAMETWPLFVEAKMFILPQGYDFNDKMGCFYNITAGIKHDINYYPHHRALYGESRGWLNDWFVGFGGGLNYSVYRKVSIDNVLNQAANTAGVEIDNTLASEVAPNQESNVKPSDRIGWNADLTVGRNFSNLWTLRIGLSMMRGTMEKVYVVNTNPEPYHYDFFNLRTDVLFNVVGLFNGKHERFNLMPYLGAGSVERFDERKVMLAANAGIFARITLPGSLDIFADARYLMVPPRFVSNNQGSMFSNGFPILNLGLLYNFKPYDVRGIKGVND